MITITKTHLILISLLLLVIPVLAQPNPGHSWNSIECTDCILAQHIGPIGACSNICTDATGGGGYWSLLDGTIYPTNTAYNVSIGTNDNWGSKLHIDMGSRTNPVMISGTSITYKDLQFRDSTSGERWKWTHTPDSDGNRFEIWYHDGTDWNITPRLSIKTDGNIGIGTTAPSYKLDVTGTISATVDVRAGDDLIFYGDILPDGSACADGQILQRISASNWDCVNPPTGGSSYWTRSGSYLYPSTITDSVGIGTTSPSSLLDLRSDIAPQLTVGYRSVSGWYTTLDHTGKFNLVAPSTNYIRFQLNGADQMVIDRNGNVGIGTTTPSGRLHVYGGLPGLIVQHSTSPNDWIEIWPDDAALIAKRGIPIRFGHADNFAAANWVESMRIESDGRGIGIPFYNGGTMYLRRNTHWDSVSGIDAIGAAGEFRFSSDVGELNVRSDGYIIASSSMQAPIFYDLDNTGYYINPAGNSQVSSIYANGWFRAQGQSGLYFQDYGGGWYMTDTSYIRAYNGKAVYVSNAVYATAFVDVGNTGYYADPASTSYFNALNLGGKSKSNWNFGGMLQYTAYRSCGSGTGITQTNSGLYYPEWICSLNKVQLGETDGAEYATCFVQWDGSYQWYVQAILSNCGDQWADCAMTCFRM